MFCTFILSTSVASVHVSRKQWSTSESGSGYNRLLLANLVLRFDQFANISFTFSTLSPSPRITDSLRIAALSNLQTQPQQKNLVKTGVRINSISHRISQNCLTQGRFSGINQLKRHSHQKANLFILVYIATFL